MDVIVLERPRLCPRGAADGTWVPKMDVLLDWEGVVDWERMSDIGFGCACCGREKFLDGDCTGGGLAGVMTAGVVEVEGYRLKWERGRTLDGAMIGAEESREVRDVIA